MENQNQPQPVSSGEQKKSSLSLIIIGIILALGIGGYFVFSKMQDGGPKEAGSVQLIEAENVVPAQTQVFGNFALTALLWDKYYQKMIPLLLTNIKPEDNQKFEAKVGFAPTEANLRAFIPQDGFFAAWPVNQLSLLTAMKQQLPNAPLNFGFVVSGHYKEVDVLMQNINKALATITNKEGAHLAVAEESFQGGQFKTITMGEKATLGLYHKDNRVVFASHAAELKAILARSSENPSGFAKDELYQKAKKQARKTDSGFFFFNLKSFLGSDFETQFAALPPSVAAFIKSFDYISAATGFENKTLFSTLTIHVENALAPLAAILFKQLNVPEIKAWNTIGADSDIFYTLNIKTIWQVAYQVMGLYPEYAAKRDMPATMLKQMMNLDLEQDVLSALTGELSVAVKIKGLTDKILPMQAQNPGQRPDPTAILNALGDSYLMLGVSDRAKVEKLLQTLAGPFLMTAEKMTHKNTEITTLPNMFSFSFVKEMLVVAPSAGALQNLIDTNEKGDSLHQSHQEVIKKLFPTTPLVTCYMNMKSYYGELNKVMGALPNQGAANDQFADQYKAMMTAMQEAMGPVWYGVDFSTQGLIVNTAMELPAQ